MIAAQADNARGIAGIAPGVKIRPVRVLGRCGGWDSDILAGITWASGGTVSGVPSTVPAAQVVNLSLGGYTDSIAERDSVCEAYNAVASAGRARGSLFVAAAGNDFGNANMSVPAACSQFISVAATSIKGFSSSYSNVGSSVDLSAPGGDSLVEGSADRILSLINTSKTDPASGSYAYARHEGTSMAAPEVSAGAALLYSLGSLDTRQRAERPLCVGCPVPRPVQHVRGQAGQDRRRVLHDGSQLLGSLMVWARDPRSEQGADPAGEAHHQRQSHRSVNP